VEIRNTQLKSHVSLKHKSLTKQKDMWAGVEQQAKFGNNFVIIITRNMYIKLKYIKVR
jgi:hypothetical protein